MKNNDSIAWYYRQASNALKFVKRYPEHRGIVNKYYELEGASVSILQFFGANDYNKACRIKRAFFRKANQIVDEKRYWRRKNEKMV